MFWLHLASLVPVQQVQSHQRHLAGAETSEPMVWEERSTYLYYAEFCSESSAQLARLLHFIHVWTM